MPEPTDRPRRGVSLEHKLPMLMSALLFIVLAISLLVSYREILRSSELAMSDRLTRIGVQLTAIAESSLAVPTRLRQVAASPAIREALAGSDTSAAHDLLARVYAQSESSLPVELWTVDGRRVARSRPPSATTMDGVETADVLPAPFTDSMAVGPLFSDGRRTVYWLAVRVIDGDSTIGYLLQERRLVVSPRTEQLLGEFAGARLTVHVRNAGNDFWATLAGQPSTPAPIPPGHGDTASLARYSRPGAATLMAASVAVEGTPWQFVVEVPHDPLRTRAVGTTARIGVASLLVMLAGVLITWVLVRRFTRPLGELTLAAEAVAAGDFSRRVRPHGHDEVGRLAASFNQMAVEVSASHAELAEQVVEQQSLSQELAGANERLHLTAAEAERARDAAEAARRAAEEARATAMAANRAKSDFLATMSHEIRTPINAVLGYSELMELGLSGPLTNTQREQLARIRASTRHLLELVSEILDLAKIESRSMTVVRQEASTGAAMDAALSLIRPQATAKEIALSERCQGACGTSYLGDEHRVRQVLTNLLGNAIKFTERGGNVSVHCDVTESPPPETGLPAGHPYVGFSVSDTGIGIPAAQLDTIFQPFTQGETGGRPMYTRERTGAGLGLTISRELARLMGGEVSVASVVGEGSTFTLWLPAAERRTHPRDADLRGDEGSAGDEWSASEDSRAAARERHRRSITLVADALIVGVRPIVDRWAAALRQDPLVRIEPSLSSAEIENHVAMLVSDVALTVRAYGLPEEERAEVLRGRTLVLRAIAEQHGAQRRRIGWTDAGVSHELSLLAGIITDAVRSDDTVAADEARGVVAQLLDQVARASLGAFRLAEKGG